MLTYIRFSHCINECLLQGIVLSFADEEIIVKLSYSTNDGIFCSIPICFTLSNFFWESCITGTFLVLEEFSHTT